MQLTFLSGSVNPVVLWGVNQLQHQRSPGDDAGSTGQNGAAD